MAEAEARPEAPNQTVTPTREVYLSYIGTVNEKNVETLIARINGEISTGATTIHLLLSSYGGLVAPGFAGHALLKGLPVELITHNTGNVGSIANVLFLAGKRRYCTPSATFYFHGTSGGQPNSNAATLKSAIEGINIDNNRTVNLVADETGMTHKKVRSLLTSVGTTLNAEGAVSCGLVHEARDVAIPPGASFYQLILTA